jgi:hypothetical protein
MKVHEIQWECISCGHQHSFRRGLAEGDDWPNKFDDLECENPDCGHEQDVALRKCTVTEIEGQ